MLTGHVIFKLRYNQIYQLKTTLDLSLCIQLCVMLWYSLLGLMVSESDSTSASISWDKYTDLEATDFSRYIITVTDKYNTTGTSQWTIRSVHVF